MTYQIYWEKAGIYKKIFGQVNILEIQEAKCKLFIDERFKHAKYQLWDFSKVDNITINKDDAFMLSALDKSAMRWLNKKMKVAVVTKNPLIIDFILKYKILINLTKWSCELFTSTTRARKWIKSKNTKVIH